MTERSFQGSAAITVAAAELEETAQGRAIGVNCTVAGNVSLKLNDSSTIIIPVAVGWSELFYKARGIPASTATATYYVLK